MSVYESPPIFFEWLQTLTFLQINYVSSPVSNHFSLIHDWTRKSCLWILCNYDTLTDHQKFGHLHDLQGFHKFLIRDFICNTNVGFLAFLCKIDIERFWKVSTKSCPQWELNSQPLLVLEVWCASNSTHFSYLSSLRLWDLYKVIIYWT